MPSLIVLVLAAAILIGSGGGFAVGRATASSPQPGSEADPLTTKSYVDRLAQWGIVILEPGRTLVASQGAELLLRAGRAEAIAVAAGGLADLTQGKDLANLEPVKANHLLLAPRGDGRGLRAVTQAILLVRGDYQIR